MDFSLASLLLLDGVSNGAIYALLALAIVLVFTVTRVIFIPQGEFVAFAALSMGMLQNGQVPGTAMLLACLAGIAIVADVATGIRARTSVRSMALVACKTGAIPFAVCAATYLLAPHKPSILVQVVLTLALITPMGPLVYRLGYRALAHSSVLVLLIVSVGVHFALTGLGLLVFGAEGSRTSAFWDGMVTLGSLRMSGQTVIILSVTALLIAGLYVALERTLWGTALRATAVNRLGASLMGIRVTKSGELSFALAAFIGALSGLLIGPTTTVFYDTGFIIGLKGFVAAVFAGLASFPLALTGALVIGLIEAFGSFWASAFKEVIVFSVIIPLLLWRSFRDPHSTEH